MDVLFNTNDGRFNCKSKLCVICASNVVEDSYDEDIDNGSHQSQVNSDFCSPEIFLKGISVLCDTLNIEPRHVNNEDWAVPGVGNFTNFVCCKKCYELFQNLVSLHELIIATQTSLRNDAGKVKDCIVQSEEIAKDIEYSIDTCLKFRKHILKSDGRKNRTTGSPRKNIKSQRSTFQSLKHESSVENKNHLNPIVKLERLDLVETEIQDDFEEAVPDNEDAISDNFFIQDSDQDHDIHENVDGPFGVFSDDHYDTHNNTSCNVIPQNMPRKMGRPRKIVPQSDGDEPLVKRKRGRPRKHVLVENLVKRKRGRPPKPRDESAVIVKRPRGRPKRNEAEKDGGGDGDDEYIPNRLTVKRKAPKKTRVMKRLPCSGPRKMGRPLKHDPSIVPEGPRRTPVFVLDITNGGLMFLNVHIQKDEKSLLCKNPGCNFSVPLQGYFMEQMAYNSMRLHIRGVHRRRSKTIDGELRKHFYCFHCDMDFKSKRILMVHAKSMHSTALVPLTLCEICGEIMEHQYIFQHVMAHKNEAEKAEALANSNLTNSDTKPKDNYRKRVAPKDLVTYPCNQCGKVCRTKGQANIHRKSHIPIELRRQVVCDICGDRVSCANNLKIHKKFVHFRSEIPTAFECRICGQKFLHTEKIRYEVHMNSHKGERPYQCSECGKSFFAKRNLNLHEQMVHTSKSMQCEFCPKWYKNPKSLRRHHVAHHPEFRPKIRCRNSYDTRKRYGPTLMFPCEPCHRVFDFKSRLVKHLKHKHNMYFDKSEDYPNQMTLEDAASNLLFSGTSRINL